MGQEEPPVCRALLSKCTSQVTDRNKTRSGIDLAAQPDLTEVAQGLHAAATALRALRSRANSSWVSS